ncbi:MAG: hypothetical protein IH888_04275, partial [Planctomycetes bacterium]|nr:hypothetical protein [Planctomycetota bacterium]
MPFEGSTDGSATAGFVDQPPLDFARGDNQPVNFGPASLEWDTTDANANALLLSLPTGGGTDVPVFAIGIGLAGVDLGLFNGLTQPAFAVVDADRDTALVIDFSADDVGRIGMLGTGNQIDIVDNTGTAIFSFRPFSNRNFTSANTFTSTSAVTLGSLQLTGESTTASVGGDYAVLDVIMILGANNNQNWTLPITSGGGLKGINSRLQTLGTPSGTITAAVNYFAEAGFSTITVTERFGFYVGDMTGGATLVTQHGFATQTLDAATTNYHITLGNTDVDQNLIHVGVTGDPIFSWSEASDIFALTHGLTISAGTLTAGTLQLGDPGSTTGILTFNGATSGTITMQSAAAAGTWTWTLPVNDGDADQFLQTNGAGVTIWAAVSAGAVTALNNQAANRLVTIGAVTTELDGEGNLTFDGTTLALTGAMTTSSTLTLSGDLIMSGAAGRWSSGVAVVAGEYSIQRDADATNQLHLNV